MNFSTSALILLSATSYSTTHGFMGDNAIRNNYQHRHVFKPNTKSYKTSSSSSSLKVADIIIGHTFSSNIIESSSIEISNEECSLMGKFFHRCSSDPSLEAEVLNDVGHVFLDMFTFVTKEGSMIARLLAVIGRLAFIASDYIPDHVIRPDELVFQMSMLAIASARLSQGLLPVASSMLSSSSSIREKKAYTVRVAHSSKQLF